jgi:hypothetical protein
MIISVGIVSIMNMLDTIQRDIVENIETIVGQMTAVAHIPLEVVEGDAT